MSENRITELMERFAFTLEAGEELFCKFVEEKGEAWLQDNIDATFTGVLKLSARLLLAADDDIEKVHDLAVGLMLSSMMLAERYRRMLDEEPGDIPY